MLIAFHYPKLEIKDLRLGKNNGQPLCTLSYPVCGPICQQESPQNCGFSYLANVGPGATWGCTPPSAGVSASPLGCPWGLHVHQLAHAQYRGHHCTNAKFTPAQWHSICSPEGGVTCSSLRGVLWLDASAQVQTLYLRSGILGAPLGDSPPSGRCSTGGGCSTASAGVTHWRSVISLITSPLLRLVT